MADDLGAAKPSIETFVHRLGSGRRALVVAAHAAIFAASYVLAFQLRFDFAIPATQWDAVWLGLPVVVAARLVTFGWFRLYEGLWRYVSVRDLTAIGKAVAISSAASIAVAYILGLRGIPRSVFLLDLVLCGVLVGGVRMAIRVVREARVPQVGERRRALIVGAGDAGEALLREITRNPTLPYDVVGFVDDDPRKRRVRIHGVGVLGSVEELPRVCEDKNVREVLIATPTATTEDHRRIAQACKASRVTFKSVPRLVDLVSGKATIAQLHAIGPEDLLHRDAVHLDVDAIREEHTGKRVLVTGAGGSIGAELCRQLASFAPDTLVLLERAESALYYVDLELRQAYPGLKVVAVVGDVCDAEKVRLVMESFAPDVVYHAAAYKHVPLMEDHPFEAVENNVRGTEVVARAAADAGVGRFVLISTDKAVRPVGIMGMTKRVAEGVLQSLQDTGTVFCSVRFGNVLGSDGSVIPLFRRQIAAGGPVTVTDPDATRWFMLISEAAQLVLQAGTLGRGGEIFFLDMGEPVKVYDLAENLIRMAGLEPGRDVAIEITGLRPGERLSEELVHESEDHLPSSHEKILVVGNGHFDADAFRSELARLYDALGGRDREAVVTQLRGLASRY